MAVGDIDTFYGQSPWDNLELNQRQWYDPYLLDVWRKHNVYGQFTTYVQNLANRNAKTMTFNGLYDIHPDTTALGLRTMWLDAAWVDSFQIDITFSRFGGKVSYHRFDDLITYWRDGGGSEKGVIRRVLNGKLGRQMVDVFDLLSRNALLSVPYKRYAVGRADFNSITVQDKFEIPMLDEIHLGMQYRDVPGAANPSGDVATIVGIISPGVYFDIQKNSSDKDWLIPMAYARPTALLKYEVGTYRNVRWVVSPKQTLWNCGTIIEQRTITSSAPAGTGSPSTKVDGVYRVGQTSMTHYLQLDAGPTDIVANDIITIHKTRTNGNGVTNGVDYTEGTLHNRRVISVDTVNHRITLDQPIMTDFDTDLGGGVFGWVTKGVHVHASTFIGGPDAIVTGVGRPVELHTPPPIDDFDSIYRYSWDGYFGHQVYNPKVAETVFSAGSVRMVGEMLQ